MNKFYQDKNIQLYNADSAKLLKQFNDQCIDLTVTSPPYDDLRIYNGYSFNFTQIAKQLYRITKKGGVVVWVVGDSTINGSETCNSFKQALFFKQIGFNLHDTMIWNKGSFAFPSTSRYHQIFEYMFVFSKGKPKTMNFICDRKNIYIGKRGASGRDKYGKRRCGTSIVNNQYGKRFNIWQYPIGGNHSSKDKCAFEHPAIFPQDLAKDHILSWSNQGDLILDPFAGSGTTLKMAKQYDRKAIGIEISKQYCDLIVNRLQKDIVENINLF